MEETISPLLSQPLVELCLRIPSYTHFHEGRDRGLARRAFADAVPTPILARTWKDRVPGFPEEILRVNLPHIREMLLEGILVRERYLDRAALETALTGAALEATASVGEILDHMLVEAWLRSWSERGRRPRQAAKALPVLAHAQSDDHAPNGEAFAASKLRLCPGWPATNGGRPVGEIVEAQRHGGVLEES